MDFGKLMSKYIFTSRIHLIVKDSAINEIPSHQDYYNNLIRMSSVYVQLDGISDAPTVWVLIPNLHLGRLLNKRFGNKSVPLQDTCTGRLHLPYPTHGFQDPNSAFVHLRLLWLENQVHPGITCTTLQKEIG